MCQMNKYGFPRTAPKAAKRVYGFQTGDMVRLTMVKGKYRGVYSGKVTVRTSGVFDLTTEAKHKISATWKRFTLLQRFDGYGAVRLTPRTVTFSAPDALVAFRAFYTLMALASYAN